MNNNIELRKIGNFIYRERLPGGKKPRELLIMLHGWTGDENSMWIFSSRIPDDYFVVSPRGFWSAPLGGYGWRKNGSGDHARTEDFQPAIATLNEFISVLNHPGINTDQYNLIGFSEGAALCYTLALENPDRVNKLAGISGFVPDDVVIESSRTSLSGKSIFVAHGTRDKLVSVDKARQVVKVLKRAGAEVRYCEEDVGHKLSANCFRGLGEYFRENE